MVLTVNMVRALAQEVDAMKGRGIVNEKHLLDTDETLVLLAARVATLTQALRLTVEYVGLETLHPTVGWDWFEALSSEPWFDEWLSNMPRLVPSSADADTTVKGGSSHEGDKV